MVAAAKGQPAVRSDAINDRMSEEIASADTLAEIKKLPWNHSRSAGAGAFGCSDDITRYRAFGDSVGFRITH